MKGKKKNERKYFVLTDTDSVQTVSVSQQAQCHRHRHSPNCTGGTTTPLYSQCLPTQTLSKLYRWYNNSTVFTVPTVTDTLQTVPVVQQLHCIHSAYRHRHSPNCTGCTTTPLYSQCLPTQTLSKLYRWYNNSTVFTVPTDTDTLQTVPVVQLHCMHSAYRHRHSPNCTGGTAPLYSQCLLSQWVP